MKIFFFVKFCMFLPPLLKIFYFCYTPKVSFFCCVHLCMKCSFDVSILEEISSLSYSIVFLYFVALITEEGFPFLIAINWNFDFRWVHLSLSPLPLASLLFSATFKVFSDNSFSFLHLFFLGMIFITASCTISQTSIHVSLGTLSIKFNPLNMCHFHCVIIWDLIWVIYEWSSGSPYFI